MSPSTRREWIEIDTLCVYAEPDESLPPHGGSGLKYRAAQEVGGSDMVSLHTEGVD